ncbi:DMT family transporter [Gordonia soli]|uniref:EamA domain-containing protein n=1 Tax=Gordonia soli NBRC 108243 TaxID=1223545 RepID=M0QJE2_9ACTN|nr:DMT family transporter [Gordonia soli]GAC67552.1 hypothetical protein GS4_08_01370 [Gordonia soli NBRC 108243]
MRSRTPDLAMLAAGATVVLWATSFVVIRDVGDTFSPGSMAFIRLFFAIIALAIIAMVSARRHDKRGRDERGGQAQAGGSRGTARLPRGRALLLVLLYGAAWFGGYTVILNWAEQHLDAGTASLLVNFAPVLVAVFAGLFLGEGFSRSLLIGISLAFAGVVVISLGGGDLSADWLGIVLGLVAAFLYALGVLLQKVALRTVDAVTATWLGASAGFVVTLPFAPTAVHELATASAGQIAAVAYLGIGPTAIAFTTWAYALARTDAGTLAATSLIVPAIVIVMSWLVLGEIPTPIRIAGGVLCLFGVAVTRGLIRRPRRGDTGQTSASGAGGAGPTRAEPVVDAGTGEAHPVR